MREITVLYHHHTPSIPPRGIAWKEYRFDIHKGHSKGVMNFYIKEMCHKDAWLLVNLKIFPLLPIIFCETVLEVFFRVFVRCNKIYCEYFLQTPASRKPGCTDQTTRHTHPRCSPGPTTCDFRLISNVKMT